MSSQEFLFSFRFHRTLLSTSLPPFFMLFVVILMLANRDQSNG